MLSRANAATVFTHEIIFYFFLMILGRHVLFTNAVAHASIVAHSTVSADAFTDQTILLQQRHHLFIGLQHHTIFHSVHDVGFNQAFFTQIDGEVIACGWFIDPGFSFSDVVAECFHLASNR